MMDVQELAGVLDAALLERREIAPLTTTYGAFDPPRAYEIQRALLQKRLARGERVIGYKMGLTSEAKRRQMSLDAPVFGPLTGAMQLDGSVRVADGIHPKAEPEIYFVTRRALQGRISRDQAFDALEAVGAAIEVLDSRFTGFKYFSLPDVIADNCSSWRFQLGPRCAPRDVGGLRMTFNGESADSSAISGHPLESLVQLVEMLGAPLPAGSVVLAGAAMAARQLEPGLTVTLEVEQLAPVTLRAL